MTEHGHQVRSEDDRISTGKIVVVGVASLVLFFFASLATAMYFRVRLGEHPALPVPAEIGRSKIGLVEQQLFDKAERGTRDRARRQDRLGSYGWVDRGRGVVHLPIDRAMELVVKGERPAPAAPPEPASAPPRGGQP
jgi:hypothetical protein